MSFETDSEASGGNGKVFGCGRNERSHLARGRGAFANSVKT